MNTITSKDGTRGSGIAKSLERAIAPDSYDLLPEVPSFTLESNDVKDREPLDPRFARSSFGRQDISPELHWESFPLARRSEARRHGGHYARCRRLQPYAAHPRTHGHSSHVRGLTAAGKYGEAEERSCESRLTAALALRAAGLETVIFDGPGLWRAATWRAVETRLPGKCRIATRRRPSSRPIRSHTGDW